MKNKFPKQIAIYLLLFSIVIAVSVVIFISKEKDVGTDSKASSMFSEATKTIMSKIDFNNVITVVVVAIGLLVLILMLIFMAKRRNRLKIDSRAPLPVQVNLTPTPLPKAEVELPAKPLANTNIMPPKIPVSNLAQGSQVNNAEITVGYDQTSQGAAPKQAPKTPEIEQTPVATEPNITFDDGYKEADNNIANTPPKKI